MEHPRGPFYSRSRGLVCKQASPQELIGNRKAEAEAFFRRIGITFAVYGDEQGAERIIPFDIVPRIISSNGEWTRLSLEGLEQRVQARSTPSSRDVYGAARYRPGRALCRRI